MHGQQNVKIKRNVEAPLPIHCCRIVIRDLPHSEIFFHILLNTQFSRKKDLLNLKLCFDFLCNFYLSHFSFYDEFFEILS